MRDTDKRWDELGRSLINWSLKMQPGEKLMIAMYETETYPLALACYKECIKAGGYPQIQFMRGESSKVPEGDGRHLRNEMEKYQVGTRQSP